MSVKVVVTGAGIVSALGVGVEPTLDALRAKRSGVAPVRLLPTDHRDLPVGEVPLTNAQLAELTGTTHPVSLLRTAMLAIAAGREAVQSAGLTAADMTDCPVISGTTVGGMDLTEQHFATLLDTGRVEGTDGLNYNDAGHHSLMLARALGAGGMVTTSSTACSSAANAIILGANMIRAGLAEVAIVGGSEALSRFHLNGFNTLMILDPQRCRPFDADRAGINLGEGAAYLVIESESHALARGAKPIATVSGYANCCDAFHQTATSPEGEGAYRSMTKALAMARLTPADICYINTHGTGTPNNDQTELAAMQRVWPDGLPPFSSTKPYTGHTTSASGSIEAVICLLAMQHGFLPPNLGFTTPIAAGAEPVTDLRTAQLKHVVNNSFGFGGNDSTIIFSQYE